MGKFNIVLIQPVNYTFSQTFYEAVELFYYAFRELGYETIISINEIFENYKNIVFGAHLVDLTMLKDAHIFLFQTEDFRVPGKWKNILRANISIAAEVWDYSDMNFKHYEHRNRKVIDLKYQKELDRIDSLEKNIDVLFYGALTDRRTEFLDKLKCRVIAPNLAWGRIRDNLIARSKIVIGIGSFGSATEEEMKIRYHYLYNNKSCVLHEPTIEKIRFYLENDAWESIALYKYESFRKEPMARYLENIL